MRKRVGSLLSLYGTRPVWGIDFLHINSGNTNLIFYYTKLVEGIIFAIQKEFFQFSIINWVVKKINSNFYNFYIYYWIKPVRAYTKVKNTDLFFTLKESLKKKFKKVLMKDFKYNIYFLKSKTPSYFLIKNLKLDIKNYHYLFQSEVEHFSKERFKFLKFRLLEYSIKSNFRYIYYKTPVIDNQNIYNISYEIFKNIKKNRKQSLCNYFNNYKYRKSTLKKKNLALYEINSLADAYKFVKASPQEKWLFNTIIFKIIKVKFEFYLQYFFKGTFSLFLTNIFVLLPPIKFKALVISKLFKFQKAYFFWQNILTLAISFTLFDARPLAKLISQFISYNKDEHYFFLKSLKYLIEAIKDFCFKYISGLSFIVCGKLRGNKRKKNFMVNIGNYTLTDYSSKFSFFKSLSCTRFGVFSIKVLLVKVYL